MLLAFFVVLTVGALGIRLLVRHSRSPRPSAPVAAEDRPFWPVALVLGGLCVVPFLLYPGRYVVDTQFVFAWNPQRMLDVARSIWQVKLDLGGTTPSGPLLPTAFVAALRSLGASAWLAQRVWFASLLALGTIGTAAVAHFFLPRFRAAALVAGLAFLAAPFVVGYFFPTWLFLSAAVCPLLVLAVLRGTTTTSRWRWAAVAALLATGAMFNPPAMVYAMIPVVAAFVYVRVSGRARWRAITAWIGCVAVFAVPMLAPYLLAVLFQASTLQSSLAATESFTAVSQSSSWPESLRGLGEWLVYWNPGGRLVFPYVEPYLSNWVVVLATFVPVVAALAVVAVSRRRARLMFGAVLVVCAALMVGGYPIDAPSPLGFWLSDVFDAIPNALVFRNVYKAGAGLVLAVAVLLSFGVDWFLTRWHSPRLRVVGAVATVAVLVVSSFPLWSGGLLRNGQQIDDGIPAYWSAATKWLDAQPGDGRVLVAPVSDGQVYRWGDTTWGDMFTSLLSRPVVLGGIFPASSGDAGDLVQALATDLSTGKYTPGTLAPIARRLGISYLVIRNDLDWQTAGGVRPADLASLRQDPTLEPVAQFGRRGENTTSPRDHSSTARTERRLRPVEVFRIPGAHGGARVVSQVPPLLVSGDGQAWPELADAGLLDALGPVRYTGRVDRATLERELAAGATVAVTDTNRRASVLVGASRETLPVSDTDQVGDRFDRAGSQTVATYGDATAINEVGPPRLYRAGPAHRAWAAFDGDPTTEWLTGHYTPILGEYLDVRLARPHRVSSISVQAATPEGGRIADSVRIWLDDRTPHDLDLDADHRGTLDVRPQLVRHLRIAVTGVTGDGGGPYGLADVQVSGVDLVRRLRVPDDVTRAARQDPAVQRELETSPTQFLFARERDVEEDPEPTLRRVFSVPAARSYTGSMTLQVDDQTTEGAVARLVGGPVQAIGTPLDGAARTSRGVDAVDGDLTTAWRVAAGTRSRLKVAMPEQEVRTIGLRLPVATAASLTDASLVVDGTVVGTRSGADCASDARQGQPTTCTVEFGVPPQTAASYELTLTAGAHAVDVAEVEVNGVPNPPPPASPACRTDLLEVDGSPVGVTLEGSLDDLRAGNPVTARFCDATALTAGRHTLSSADGLPVVRVRLEAVGGRTPVAAVALASRTRSGATSAVVRVGGDQAAWVISGQAMATQWSAESGGRGLADAEELDTQAGWRLPAGSSRVVEVSFATQTTYRIALLLSVVAMALAYVTMITDPRMRVRRLMATRVVSRRAWRLGFEALSVAFVFAIGGAVQVGVLVAVLVALRRRWLTPGVVTLVAAVLVVFAVVSTVPPIGPTLGLVDPAWPIRRQDAQFFVLQAVVLFVGGLAGFARQALDDRPRDDRPRDDRPLDESRESQAVPDLEAGAGPHPNGGGSRRAPSWSPADAPTAPTRQEHLR